METTPASGPASGLRAATAVEVAPRVGAVAPATLLACGPTHPPRVVAPAGVLVVNPGSMGLLGDGLVERPRLDARHDAAA